MRFEQPCFPVTFECKPHRLEVGWINNSWFSLHARSQKNNPLPSSNQPEKASGTQTEDSFIKGVHLNDGAKEPKGCIYIWNSYSS